MNKICIKNFCNVVISIIFTDWLLLGFTKSRNLMKNMSNVLVFTTLYIKKGHRKGNLCLTSI